MAQNVLSISLVKRMSKGNPEKNKQPRPYTAVSFDLGYREILFFPSEVEIKALFGMTDKEFYEMQVGDVKPLIFK